MSELLGQYVGRYHIVEKLGSGGMATVYKAFDSRLERDVAIKFIRPDVVRDEMFLKRFEREAKALARLSSPNIVKVLDYGEHEGMPYLVMEYIRGDTLKSRLGMPIPWREAARLLLPAAEALDYTHKQNIIHRDVKPSNFLVSDSGHLMLSDFGIAKMLDTPDAVQLTGTGVGIGTPEYMAPEQGLGQSIDQRADVYSLGIVFYEMVTGRKPYSADTPMAVMYKQISDPLPSPRQFVPGLPAFVEKVLFKALAKKPEDRYQDMAAFAKALQDMTETPAPTDDVGTRVAVPDTQQMQTRLYESPSQPAPSQPYQAAASQAESWSQPAAPVSQPVARPAAPSQKKKSTPLWITCGVIFVVVACIIIVAVTGGFGALMAMFGPDPEGLAADVFVPSTVEMGREFEVTVTLRNEGSKEIRVNQIQVPQNLLAVATLSRTNPQYTDIFVYDSTDSTGYDFDIPLPPGGSREVVFYFNPLQTADVSGRWDVRVGTRSLGNDLRVIIVDPVAQAPTSTIPAPPTAAPPTAAPPTEEPPDPPVDANWTQVWEDDFSDPASGFYVGESEDRAFWYEDGEYKIEGIKDNWLVWVYLGYTLNDVQINVDARIENSAGASAYGLLCRYQGDGNYYGFEFSEDGFYTIWLRYNSEYTDLVEWTYDSRLEGTSSKRMTVECDGDRLALYLDGELLEATTDSTLTFGDVGLLVESDDAGNSLVAFDNFALFER